VARGPENGRSKAISAALAEQSAVSNPFAEKRLVGGVDSQHRNIDLAERIEY
jgi:hypothetical protein